MRLGLWSGLGGVASKTLLWALLCEECWKRLGANWKGDGKILEGSIDGLDRHLND